jgi:hypothetical protein
LSENEKKQTATHNDVCCPDTTSNEVTGEGGAELNFENLSRKHAVADKERNCVRATVH